MRLLFLHGAGGGPWQWEQWLRVFSPHDCRVPDIRVTDKPTPAVTLADYADLVRRECEQFRPQAIIGASMGGWLAARHARLTDALILVNAVPLQGHGKLVAAAVKRWTLASIAGTLAADISYGVACRATSLWRDESGAVLNGLVEGGAHKPPRVPTLVLAGERDEEVPLDVQRSYAAQLGADFRTVHGATHLGPIMGKSAGKAAAAALRWLS